jgi:hypothetical protein
MVAARALLQRLADLDVVCHAFALAESSDMSMLLVGTAAVPLFVALLTSAWAGAGVALVITIALTAALPHLARGERTVSVSAEVVDQLRRSPIFGLLPPADLETLARCATPLVAPAGTPLIREGEPGDRYYVLVSGSVVVTRDGREVNRLGPGDGFGEVALLHTYRRTATVTALEDLEVLAVDRGPFVLTVTGHPEALDLTKRHAGVQGVPG